MAATYKFVWQESYDGTVKSVNGAMKILVLKQFV